MEHKDLMILHRLKYKHIGTLLLLLGAASSYWTVEPDVTFAGMFSLACCILLIIVIIVKIINKWDDEIL